MQIGAEARAEKKNFRLAQIFDEMCRQKWAERALRGNFKFSLISTVRLQFVVADRRPGLQCQ